MGGYTMMLAIEDFLRTVKSVAIHRELGDNL
jgi:hypothetical protein